MLSLRNADADADTDKDTDPDADKDAIPTAEPGGGLARKANRNTRHENFAC